MAAEDASVWEYVSAWRMGGESTVEVMLTAEASSEHFEGFLDQFETAFEGRDQMRLTAAMGVAAQDDEVFYLYRIGNSEG